ncbi:hypothetical protein AB0O64_23555 [Streptomyces sp. NPDC088341]|uniref:hypothetical protein n=1 Tax=Streptomyces sp. NPDC088341 TaxID=3154870 RepID=UPI00341ADD48
MSTTKPDTVTCTACGTQVPRPADVQWRPLWDAGWRWVGSQDLYSCPDCPPVIVVDDQGRHRSPQQIEQAASH